MRRKKVRCPCCDKFISSSNRKTMKRATISLSKPRAVQHACSFGQTPWSRPFSSVSRPSVAVIGAGPSGLVTCKEMQVQGFDAQIFEHSGDLGGQWNVSNPKSGPLLIPPTHQRVAPFFRHTLTKKIYNTAVWPSMRTNSICYIQGYSDFPFRGLDDYMTQNPKSTNPTSNNTSKITPQNSIFTKILLIIRLLPILPSMKTDKNGAFNAWIT